MLKSRLNLISSVDGRYGEQTDELEKYFSEYSLIRTRIMCELYYVKHIIKEIFNEDIKLNIPVVINNFTLEDAEKVKHIERDTNHDVKSVEIYLRNLFDELDLSGHKEYIHFGLTSQDINSFSWNYLIREYLNNVYLPKLERIIKQLGILSKESDCPMMSRTHGQPATPTKMSKELMVFVSRLKKQYNILKKYNFSVKFSGAVGNHNAQQISHPEIDWFKFTEDFLSDFDFDTQYPTTQIEIYDNLTELFDTMKRVNVILIDFCRDIWNYISMDYFILKSNNEEVGSSTMPHKTNPINFENAEGNLGISNALLNYYSEKLPVSRLQRDLTDSTVMRSLGTCNGHIIVSFNSILNGLCKLDVNETKMKLELENNWQVITEAIQTILRRENYENPYEVLKQFSKNKEITRDDIIRLLFDLNIPKHIKKEISEITPLNYLGIYK